jgi:hypothetical protein
LQAEASKAAGAIHPVPSSKRSTSYQPEQTLSLQPPPPAFSSLEHQRLLFVTGQDNKVDLDGFDALLAASEMAALPRGMKRPTPGFDGDDPFAEFPDPKRMRRSPAKIMDSSSRMDIASLLAAATVPEAMPGVMQSVEDDMPVLKQERLPSPQFLTPLPPRLDVGGGAVAVAAAGAGETAEGYLPFMAVPEKGFGGDGGWQPPIWPYQREKTLDKDEGEEEEDEEEEEGGSVLLPDPGPVVVQ